MTTIDALNERPAIAGAVFLPLNLIQPGKYQPRTRFDPEALEQLASSIEKSTLLQPIIVRPVPNAKAGAPLYEIVAGERRWRASKLIAERRNEQDIATIQAIVRELTDFEAAELALVENLKRQDLHPLEEAAGFEALMRKGSSKQGYTADELAERFKMSRRFIYGRLSLLKLVPKVRDQLLEGKLHVSVALLIAPLPTQHQEKAADECIRGWGGEPFTKRQAEKHLQDTYMLSLGSAVFDIKDASLLKKAGACTACPKRSGANPDLFEHVKGADVCTDSLCFAGKKAAHAELVIERAKKAGQKVLTGAEAKKIMPYHDGYLAEGHVDLDKPLEQVTGSKKSLRTLLGDDVPETMVVKPDHIPLPHTVAKRADVERALKAKGLVQKPGEAKAKNKPLTAADIKAGREQRIQELVELRALEDLWNKLTDGTEDGLPHESLAQLAYDTLVCGDADLGRILTIAGLRKAGETHRFGPGDVIPELRKLDGDLLANLIVMGQVSNCMVQCDLGTARGDLDPLARELGWGLEALIDEATAEVDQQLRDEIAALKAPAQKAGANKVAKAPAAKYRDPLTLQTWSGRGLQPKWLKVAIAGGKQLSDFEVGAELTPEKALAAAVAGGTSPGGEGAKPKKKTTAKSAGRGELKEQTDEAAASPQPLASPAEQTDKAPAAPAPAHDARSPAVGDTWRIRAGLGLQVREIKLVDVEPKRVLGRWGTRKQDVGYFALDEIEFVAAAAPGETQKLASVPAAAPMLSSVAAWPFPTSKVSA